MSRSSQQESLQQKITYGYYLLTSTLLLFAAIAIIDLLFLERHLQVDEVAADLSASVLELRREEKNLFLYAQEDGRQRMEHYLDQIQRLLLQQQQALQTVVARAAEIESLQQALQRYRKLIGQQIKSEREREAWQQHLRAQGHSLYLLSGAIAERARTITEQAARDSLWFLIAVLLLLGIVIFLTGRHITAVTLTPLQKLEQQMNRIARGHSRELQPPSSDREFVALTRIFNHSIRELEFRRRRMEQSEKLVSLGNLAAGVAHELNNPLSNISTSAQLLSEELEGEPTPLVHNWLQQIDQETQRGKEIVRALLEFGSKRSFQKQPLELAGLLDETLRLLNKPMERHQVSLQLNIPSWIVVEADKQRLQQVLINLIENAIEAAGEHELKLRISADHCELGVAMLPQRALVGGGSLCSGDDKGRFIEILIDDDGPGIDPEHLPYVLDPFYTRRANDKGTGLGLFISHEIIKQHEGCIAIDSTPGKGTRVTLLLPVSPDREEEVSADA